MKVLFATSECAPFSKSGGLADVAYSLPPALKRKGNDVAIITPLYKCVRDRFADQIKKVKDCNILHGGKTYITGLYKGECDGVTVWFIEYDEYFDRPKLYGYDDDKNRFAFFSRAIIELLFELDFVPDIIHCNDWETALTVIYLKNDQSWRTDLKGIKSVYTIHNMAYQGQFGESELENTFALNKGWFDGGLGYIYEGRRDINLMKGAMLMADAVSTVSPTYAKELHYPQFGNGLQGVVDIVDNKLRGILNGIDMALYDPASDKRIACNFDVNDMNGKSVCKRHIQEKFSLDPEPEFPLFCSVARLVEQKGVELLKEILPYLMELGIQLIIFGQGDQKYVDYFEDCMRRWPGQFGFSDKYNDNVASEVFAGADFYLMPSRFEPCGLSQMMAMRYGTIPIVHETGGLKDSVRPYKDFDGIGDGFSFANYTGQDLILAIVEALKVFFADEDTFATLRKRCMQKDFSWNKSAGLYEKMYSDIYSGGNEAVIPFDEAFEQLENAYRDLDAYNHKKYRGAFSKIYQRVIQLNITGRASGAVTVKLACNGDDDIFEIIPERNSEADAFVTATFDDLIGMAEGKVSFDNIFLNGKLKVEGNLAKGAQIRNLLCRR